MSTPDDRAKTLTYLHGLARKDGGYADQTAAERAGLQHTASVCRALRLLDSQVVDPRGTVGFVHRCFDPRSGGFSELPGARPTVLGTALALIALRALSDRGGLAERTRLAVNFLAREARSAMDHFMVVAAHEEAELTVPPPLSSVDFFRASRHADGTFGDSAFANAIAGAALLRAGQPLAEPAPVVRRLTRAQGSDGGFSDHSGPADLLTTYAATRALMLLHAAPDLPALTRYLASLRRPDGGFGARPDARASAGATYQALAVMRAGGIKASASAERGGARASGASPSARGSRTA
jgi:hypothetical protein